jgi:hypothetical protein
MEHIFRRRHKAGDEICYFNITTGRAWAVDKKGYTCPSSLKPHNLSDDLYHPIEPWTGINDSKRTEQYPEGQMIFKNDQIVVTDECGTQTWGSVEWFSDEGYPAFDVYPRIDCDSNGLSHYTAVGEIEVVGVAVIGNVD